MQRQIDNDFADLKGLSITGHIPVNDQLINQLITEVLQGGLTSGPPSAGAAPAIDMRPLMKFVKKAEVHATDGKISLDFDVAI